MTNIGRRRFLKYLGAAGAAASLAALGYDLLPGVMQPSGATLASTSTTSKPTSSLRIGLPPAYVEFLDWLKSASKLFAGQTLSISLESETAPLAIQKIDNDFYGASGINDQYDLKPYAIHLSDIALMTRTKSSIYDVFSVDYQDVAFFKDHIISPSVLADTYPDLTFSQIIPDDFHDLSWSKLATYPSTALSGGSSSGIASTSADILLIPLDMLTMIQYYRKDLFKPSVVSPPTTWSEYISAAKAFTNSQQVPFGSVTQASPSVSVIFDYMNHLTSFGGKLWEMDGDRLVPAFNSNEGLAALENYASLAPYADPASFTYSWPDVTTSISRGIVAEAIQFQDYAYWMDDPLRSVVAGEIDYAKNPIGPSGSFSTYGGNGVGVSKYSKNPEAAWLWLQWATGAGTQEVTLLDRFHPFPSRKAVLDQSFIQQAIGGDEYRALRVALDVWNSNQMTAIISFPGWWNALQPLATYLDRAWRGFETPSVALEKAMGLINALGPLTF